MLLYILLTAVVAASRNLYVNIQFTLLHIFLQPSIDLPQILMSSLRFPYLPFHFLPFHVLNLCCFFGSVGIVSSLPSLQIA